MLLTHIIRAMRSKYGDGAVAVTASTGIAAVNIGGITIHSFAGIGLGDSPVDVLINRVLNSFRICERWKTTKVLIIDESAFFMVCRHAIINT